MQNIEGSHSQKNKEYLGEGGVSTSTGSHNLRQWPKAPQSIHVAQNWGLFNRYSKEASVLGINEELSHGAQGCITHFHSFRSTNPSFRHAYTLYVKAVFSLSRHIVNTNDLYKEYLRLIRLLGRLLLMPLCSTSAASCSANNDRVLFEAQSFLILVLAFPTKLKLENVLNYTRWAISAAKLCSVNRFSETVKTLNIKRT